MYASYRSLFARNARFFKVLADVSWECCFIAWRQVRDSKRLEQDALVAADAEIFILLSRYRAS